MINLASVKYNFDDNFTVKNKLTGNSFVNDVEKNKIYLKQAVTGAKKVIADFCITDLVWDSSNKDITSIKLVNSDASTDYTLASNHAALKNRLFKECYPSPNGNPVISSPDKKFMYFGVNGLLYEFICMIVRKIQDDTLPVGLETVTLAITSSDTASFTNGTVTITATDESSTAVQGLDITGTIGEVEVEGTTDASGQVSVTLDAAGTYAVSVESAATTAYKAATKTGSVTVTAIEAEPGTG